jgi:hypothetical protein
MLVRGLSPQYETFSDAEGVFSVDLPSDKFIAENQTNPDNYGYSFKSSNIQLLIRFYALNGDIQSEDWISVSKNEFDGQFYVSPNVLDFSAGENWISSKLSSRSERSKIFEFENRLGSERTLWLFEEIGYGLAVIKFSGTREAILENMPFINHAIDSLEWNPEILNQMLSPTSMVVSYC